MNVFTQFCNSIFIIRNISQQNYKEKSKGQRKKGEKLAPSTKSPKCFPLGGPWLFFASLPSFFPLFLWCLAEIEVSLQFQTALNN
ncbi:MAG: hypothetical protein SPF39_04560 [Prevotella sp.]|nr:hypothetical protein [Prevotella sp.]